MKNLDWRYISNGLSIPTESGYCDQPSIVKASDGTWVCSVTTGKGGEGAKGQYVNITRSTDRGATWSEPIAIEETDWESAYSSLALAPSGRIYCFYCYNLDKVDIAQVPLIRYDMGGYYCYRVSADNGMTWSERKIVPVRDFDVDLEQEERFRSFNGKPLRFFWNVSRVFFVDDTCYSALIKYHYNADDVLYSSEGVLLKCEGLDSDPENAVWETLPDGTIGLRTPAGGGRVAEEQSYVRLSDGTLFVTYRSADGHPVCTLSRDGGHTFEPARYMTYADGRMVKHNRAATFIWPLGDKRYLYWFNNQGTKSFPRRNPIWCLLGIETPTPDGLTLTFSQPELLLYHDSEHVAISYPDLLWDDGWYVTETQKVEARIHPLDPEFMRRLCAQFDRSLEVDDKPVYAWKRGEKAGRTPDMPFSQGSHAVRGDQRLLAGAGYTVSLWVEGAKAGEVIFSTQTPNGGLLVKLDDEGCVQVRMGDIMAECGVAGSFTLNDGKRHHVALVIDPRANVAYCVVDGLMDDGGERMVSGWRWMNRAIIAIPGAESARTGASLLSAEIYGRALMTCEIAALYRLVNN